jgi:hypothetical protein
LPSFLSSSHRKSSKNSHQAGKAETAQEKTSAILPSIDLFKSRITQASPNNFNKLLKNPQEEEPSLSDSHEKRKLMHAHK